MLNNQNLIKTTKEKYPAGSRIHLESMEDLYALVPHDAEGKVKYVDDEIF